MAAFGDTIGVPEIDTKDTIERSKAEIGGESPWFPKSAHITPTADEFVGSATMTAALEASAAFENMVDLMLGDAYEVYVFDAAPTTNARRLLGMSQAPSLWVSKILRAAGGRDLAERLAPTSRVAGRALMTC